ncbi:MAG: hypothetical protein D6805_01660 [Planctomycetota bacterium]|nr:MAG: hypothetical protein D6805_01660 [Planctomycetota bacterium]
MQRWQRIPWVVVGMMALGVLYASGLVLQVREERRGDLKRLYPTAYEPGEVVVKNLQRSYLDVLRRRLGDLEVAMVFGGGRYTLLRFDRELAVGRVLGELEGRCEWAEPNWKVFLLERGRAGARRGKKKSRVRRRSKRKGRVARSSKVGKGKVVRGIRPPRDAYFPLQWGAYNYGQDAPGGMVGKIGAHVDMLRAWRLTTGSKKVLVAVLDTGVDYEHPDLRENIWVNEKEKYGIAGYDDDGNGYIDDVHGWNFVSAVKTGNQAGSPDPMDDNGHGTHCAGVIGAKGNNLEGIAGLNWQVRIMALKFLNAVGSGNVVSMYRAIEYAVRNKVRVINASFGFEQKSKLLEDALRMAREAKVIICAAAGNSGRSSDRRPLYPANYEREFDNIISVAATNNLDKLASFSNFGARTVHVAAPGVRIVSTIPKNSYAAASGTSMAAPHVSGAVALLLSRNPRLSPKTVRDRLIATCDVVEDLVGRVRSWGRINVYRFLTNDRNVLAKFEKENIHTEKYRLDSLRYPTQRVDHLYKIVKPGARYIRVHFKKILTDPEWDYVEILDRYNRKIDSITEYLADSWSAWVKGDMVKIRYFAEPPYDVKVVLRGGMSMISVERGKASRTWGFSIDKIQYIKKESSSSKKEGAKKKGKRKSSKRKGKKSGKGKSSKRKGKRSGKGK